MIYDFSQAHKQSGLGIIVLFFEFAFKLLRALVFPAIILLVRGSLSSLGIMLLILLGIFILAFINAYLSYKYLNFHIDSTNNELVVQKGFLKKELVTIKLEKIQQVNLQQNFIQKILDLYAIQIDTAGGDSAEVSLKALEEPMALALKAALLEKDESLKIEFDAISDGAISNLESSPANSPVIRLDLKTLFKIGISSNYGSTLAIFFGFIVTMANQLREWRELMMEDEEDISETFSASMQFLSTGMLFGIAFIALIGIHVFRTFYTYSNFEMYLKNQALHLSSGLFSKKSNHLRARNVQITSVSQNYFQQLLGIVEIKLKQASGLKLRNEEDAPQSHLIIPGASKLEKESIVSLILKEEPLPKLSLKANYRYMFFPIAFYIGIPLAILIAYNYWVESLMMYNWLGLPYCAFMGFFIFRSFKNHQISLAENCIILQTGAWDVSKKYLVPTKIQGLSSSQYLWHKSLNIGHLEIHTAGGSLHFRYGNYTDIQKLKNYWLLNVEKSSKDWN
ncbi:MAG: hypothetical protein EOO99_03400 [Pedobacter sp.]|nr:MAG: hypothetical protein EOO99_03400 [Pedobacter sp.]